MENSEEFQTYSSKEKIKSSTVSQETIDAAASESVDENNKAGAKSYNGESIDNLETNFEAIDAQSLTQTTGQEANLVNSLNTSEEGSFENTLD